MVMPKFGQTMTEVLVIRWEKKVGFMVKKREVLLKISVAWNARGHQQ